MLFPISFSLGQHCMLGVSIIPIALRATKEVGVLAILSAIELLRKMANDKRIEFTHLS